MSKLFGLEKKALMSFCSILTLAGCLVGCGGSSEKTADDGVKVIVLQEGQSWHDVVSSSAATSSAASSDSSAGSVDLSTDPVNEGDPLFVRSSNTSQNIAGFEFCCAKYGTYEVHDFTDATGDFKKLDGGFWGSEVQGAIGERVFSSYGDGYDDAQDLSAAQVGGSATGAIKSPEFIIDSKYINFLVGGGSNRFDAINATAVVLIVDGVVVRQSHGKNEEKKIVWDSWDVSQFKGKAAKIEFIDMHPDDKSDSAVPYILADQFRAANKAAVAPAADSAVSYASAPVAADPATVGEQLFKRAADLNQNIAGFEFCCGKYDTYQNHSFIATGDFIRFDGGQWAADIGNKLGDRVFASYGQGFNDSSDSAGKWYGWEAVGTLTSPTFKINSPYINFMTAGGVNRYNTEHATAVVLRVNGKVVRQATGNGKEKELSWVSWDVSALQGQNAVVEIIDKHDNSVDDSTFPFILVDEFKQADQAAAKPVIDSVVNDANQTESLATLNIGDPNPFYKDGTYYVYYLMNSGKHSWFLSKTTDLLTATFPVEVLSASGDASQQDQWLGSGSILKDQSNNFHLFYTGHNANLTPVEAVMHAAAADGSLLRWNTQAAPNFSGTANYSNFDFRDPKVFWNDAEQNYWMLITSRYQSNAAIGLYTSTDLKSWTPQSPLYKEASPLNLEVADYLVVGGTSFITYSDQRDASRQVKYLQKSGADWVKPAANDALDGKYFYAGRSASSGTETLMFGWVPHKKGHNDSGIQDWGGDLMIHQMAKTASGELAVMMPEKLKTSMVTALPITLAWTEGTATANATSIELLANSKFVLDSLADKNRISLKATSANANAVFGVQLREAASGKLAYIKIDGANDKASFFMDGDAANSDNPSVSVPVDLTVGVDLDIVLDPKAGVGVVYINNFRALSFRLYALPKYQVGVYSEGSAVSVTNLNRYKAN